MEVFHRNYPYVEYWLNFSYTELEHIHDDLI